MADRVTLSEIAKMAGVNPSTVSRVLHEHPGSKISQSVREKILRLCDQVNYRPNTAARSVVTGKTYRAGLIFGAIQNDLASPIIGSFTKGLCHGLQECNYTLSILWAERPGDSRESQIRNFLMSEVADSYILGPALIDSPIHKTILSLQKPIIYFTETGLQPEGMSGVSSDSIHCYEDLLQRIPECWYGKILYCGIKGSEWKIVELCQAMRKLRIPESAISQALYEPGQVGFSFDRWVASGFARRNIDLLKKQKLIWCASDLTALGIADVLRENGIRPGEDIAMIGYDNLCELVSFHGKPFLTTIDPHPQKLGKMAAKLAVDAVSGPMKKTVRRIPADVIYRKSFPK